MRIALLAIMAMSAALHASTVQAGGQIQTFTVRAVVIEACSIDIRRLLLNTIGRICAAPPGMPTIAAPTQIVRTKSKDGFVVIEF